MARRKILIVDDEKEFAWLVKLNLEELGEYEVEVETVPRNVVETAKRFCPDFIFLDVVMPDLEGPDVFSELKNHNEFKNVPIVFLTATITKEEVEAHDGRIGGHQFFAKPGSLDELILCIETSFGRPPYIADFT